MTGTLLNLGTVLLGGSLGTLFGERLPQRVRESLLLALGLFTLAIGIKMTFDSRNPLIILGSVLVGGMLGEWWRIEDGLKALAGWLEAHFAKSSSPQKTQRFVRGFVSSSLVFCVGPMTILGSIQDGLTGDYQLLAIKSVLDGFASLAFSATMGAGVLFSGIVILVYQGGLTLLASQAKALLTDPMIREMTATGGLLIMGIGIGPLLELRPIRVANYLPALVIAPVIVVVLHAMGIQGF